MALYCGIDLHSNNHVMTVIDEGDRRLYERRLPNDLAITKAALEPFRSQLVAVPVESTFNWYWLVDGLMDAGYEVRLVHTGAVVQYAGLKHTDDEHDAFWLAHLMRLGILPTGYIHPKSKRGLRDLARQRMRLVQHRASHITSVQNQVWRSTAVRLGGHTIKGEGKQPWPELRDADLALSIETGRAAIDALTVQIERLEEVLLKRVGLSPQFQVLKTVTGIGPILALTSRWRWVISSAFPVSASSLPTAAAWIASGSVMRRRKVRPIARTAIHISLGRSWKRLTSPFVTCQPSSPLSLHAGGVLIAVR